MFGECHAHLVMDGFNYKKAIARYKNGIEDELIRRDLKAYHDAGVRFIRDGGDNLGVSKRAAELAPEYEIDYRTPIFAIHKGGYYGAIVGTAFDTMKEYVLRVKEVKKAKGHFIKIMTTGIMDFDHHGVITGPKLSSEWVREMVHIAHSEGFAVMTHVNGAESIEIALAAGVDSIEHGNFMNDTCLKMLKETGAVWVPTIAIVGNIIGSGRFDDHILKAIFNQQRDNIKKAFDNDACIALGSDAGAYCVPHPQGIFDEYRYFKEMIKDKKVLDCRLMMAEEKIKKTFL
ncbi:MAG: amidohydrolase family protein [Eubacterium sp.]